MVGRRGDITRSLEQEGEEGDHSTRWPGKTNLARLYSMLGYQWTPGAGETVLGSLLTRECLRL